MNKAVSSFVCRESDLQRVLSFSSSVGSAPFCCSRYCPHVCIAPFRQSAQHLTPDGSRPPTPRDLAVVLVGHPFRCLSDPEVVAHSSMTLASNGSFFSVVSSSSQYPSHLSFVASYFPTKPFPLSTFTSPGNALPQASGAIAVRQI